MKTLVVEDDFTSRLFLTVASSLRYGECHIAVNGREAVEGVPHRGRGRSEGTI